MNALPDEGTCASDVEEDIWREKVSYDEAVLLENVRIYFTFY